MGFLEFFREWRKNNQERKQFKEAWNEEYAENLGSNNNCSPYHEKVAYEIFKLTERVEYLEKTR